jgi:SAM-dependent methyltransferase
MKKLYSKIKQISLLFGFNPTVFVNFIRGLPLFIRDLNTLKRQLKQSNNKDFTTITWYPMMGDRYNLSGSMSGQYFHQDLLVARRIFARNPRKHVDIGSRVDGFVTHIAVFREIEVFDIRPQMSTVKNIVFKQADLMKLPEKLRDYCDSISSLHAIEHFGLGRYGDPVDSDGHIKGLNNIYEILKKGGTFYFSVPIGRQRIEFHGHRIFDISYLLKLFESKYIIDNFSYVDDAGDLHENVELDENNIKINCGCNNGCGIFELTKK